MKNICDGHVSPTPHAAKALSNSSTLRREAREEAKRRARLPLPGFPVVEAFRSQTQVTEYFSGDKITCLLCGRAFKQLHVHLNSIHGVTENEYKLRYGLPFRAGLNCLELHERLSDSARARTSHIALMSSLRDADVCDENRKNQRSFKKRITATHCPRCGEKLIKWASGSRNGKPRFKMGCRKCQNETRKPRVK